MSALRLQTAIVSAFVAASLLTRSAPAGGLSSAFTYQGQLTQTGTPITGPCDLQFSLFDAATSGTQLGSTQTLSAVSVTNGLFTVALNDSAQFGASAFAGSDRWLQIAVRCPAGSGSYSTLSSRQQLTAAPYALYAPTAGSAAGLSCSGCVTSGALATGAVTGSAIASGTIQQSKLGFTPGTVTSITAGTGLNGGTITTTGTISNTGVLSLAASPPLAVSGAQSPTVSLTTPLGVTYGGTGGATAAAARSSLGAAASGANTDITALLGFTGSNVALGQSALQANTSGTNNIAVGQDALGSNTTGFYNTAVGFDALQMNTTTFDATKCTALGTPNSCCIGTQSGFCTGVENTALGSLALQANTNGAENTAVGHGALDSNSSGMDNTALGVEALESNTTGLRNTGVGFFALQKNSIIFDVTKCTGSGVPNSCCNGTGTGFCGGSDNTAVGWDALAANTKGFNNIALGSSAGASLSTGSNNIDIGNTGIAGESNAIRIGTDGTQTATFIAGIYGTTLGSGMPVVVNSNGRLGYATSSARFKEEIQDMGDSTGKLMELRPVRFRYKKEIDPSGLEQYGLVAEEVAKVYPDLVVYDETGQPQAVRYHLINAMLLNEVQKQERRIAAQRQQLTDQARQMRTQAKQMETLTRRLVQVEAVLRAQKHAPTAVAHRRRS
jgi:hypothetical protein